MTRETSSRRIGRTMWCATCGREFSRFDWETNDRSCPDCGRQVVSLIETKGALWYRILKKLGVK